MRKLIIGVVSSLFIFAGSASAAAAIDPQMVALRYLQRMFLENSSQLGGSTTLHDNITRSIQQCIHGRQVELSQTASGKNSEKLKREIEELKKSVNVMQKNNDFLQRELVQAQLKAQKFTTENTDYMMQVQDITKRLKASQNSLNQAKEELDALRKKQSTDRLGSNPQQLHSEIAVLKVQLEAKNTMEQMLRGQIEEKIREISGLKDRIDRLEAREGVSLGMGVSQSSLVQLEMIRETNAQLMRLQSELMQKSSDLAQAKSEITLLQHKIDFFTSSGQDVLNAAREQEAVLQEKLANCEQARKEMEQKVDQLGRQHAQEMIECQELIKKLQNQLQASASTVLEGARNSSSLQEELAVACQKLAYAENENARLLTYYTDTIKNYEATIIQLQDELRESKNGTRLSLLPVFDPAELPVFDPAEVFDDFASLPVVTDLTHEQASVAAQAAAAKVDALPIAAVEIQPVQPVMQPHVGDLPQALVAVSSVGQATAEAVILPAGKGRSLEGQVSGGDGGALQVQELVVSPDKMQVMNRQIVVPIYRVGSSAILSDGRFESVIFFVGYQQASIDDIRSFMDGKFTNVKRFVMQKDLVIQKVKNIVSVLALDKLLFLKAFLCSYYDTFYKNAEEKSLLTISTITDHFNNHVVLSLFHKAVYEGVIGWSEDNTSVDEFFTRSKYSDIDKQSLRALITYVKTLSTEFKSSRGSKRFAPDRGPSDEEDIE